MRDYYSYLEERGLKFEPDIVIIGFGYNDIISVKTNNRLREKAQKSVSEDVENREKKVNKRVELLKRNYKTKYLSSSNFQNSSIKRYMEELVELSREEGIKTYFYNIHGAGPTRRTKYISALGADEYYIKAPKKLRKMDDPTLEGPDIHYNATAHRILGNKLAEMLRNSTT